MVPTDLMANPRRRESVYGNHATGYSHSEHDSMTRSYPHINLFTARPIAIVAYLVLVAIVLATVGYWAPWIDHDTAALKLSGQDLGEFVKFIPEIRRGQVRFPRQLFYLPPLAVSISLILLSVNRHLAYPRGLRAVMLVLALFALSGVLPPVWGHPRELFSPEFRLQGLALGVGLLMVLAHGLFRPLPLSALGPALGVLAFTSLIPPQWAFWAIRPRIWAVYDTPTIYLGWGLWLTVLAWVGMLACSVALFRIGRSMPED